LKSGSLGLPWQRRTRGDDRGPAGAGPGPAPGVRGPPLADQQGWSQLCLRL